MGGGGGAARERGLARNENTRKNISLRSARVGNWEKAAREGRVYGCQTVARFLELSSSSTSLNRHSSDFPMRQLVRSIESRWKEEGASRLEIRIFANKILSSKVSFL